MRGVGVAAVVLAATLGTTAGVRSQTAAPPSAEVRIIPPESLTVGDRASIIAEVRIVPPGDRPILLTPSSEGTAVEVVRGRLLRADAEDPNADVLRFSIPIVAATAGTAVLRVHVAGWACEERCREVEDDAELVVRVARR